MGRVYRQHCERCGNYYVGGGKRFCSYPCSKAAVGTLRERWERAVPDRPAAGCWDWAGAINSEGYGAIRDGEQKRAHRVGYEFLVGPIPPGRHVLHHCDNRRCVNPQHLYVGTQKDNNRDTRVRGRFKPRYWRANGSGKLSEEQAREIVARYRRGGIFQRELAAEYGICQGSVSQLLRNPRLA